MSPLTLLHAMMQKPGMRSPASPLMPSRVTTEDLLRSLHDTMNQQNHLSEASKVIYEQIRHQQAI